MLDFPPPKLQKVSCSASILLFEYSPAPYLHPCSAPLAPSGAPAWCIYSLFRSASNSIPHFKSLGHHFLLPLHRIIKLCPSVSLSICPSAYVYTHTRFVYVRCIYVLYIGVIEHFQSLLKELLTVVGVRT